MKEIVQDGASVLREVARPVPEDLFRTPKLASIIAQMTSTLDPEVEGVALAAPQINIPYRIFVVRKDRTVTPPPMSKDFEPGVIPAAKNEVYINPEILKTSRKRVAMDEGCLSVRGMYGTTRRHARVTIRARREDGSTFERGAGGLLAQIFEHEIDHLNGILFTDHAEHVVHITHELDT